MRELKKRKKRLFMCEEREVERFLGFRNQDCKFDERVVTEVLKRSYETVIAPDSIDCCSRVKLMRLGSFCYATSGPNLAKCGASGGPGS